MLLGIRRSASEDLASRTENGALIAIENKAFDKTLVDRGRKLTK
jgi:hypothetical protein